MERAGIESLEELYRRFMETDGPQVPAPGRNRGKPMKFEEFREHVEARYPRTYPEFMEPLAEVLSLGEEDRQALAFAYVWGERLEGCACLWTPPERDRPSGPHGPHVAGADGPR